MLALKVVTAQVDFIVFNAVETGHAEMFEKMIPFFLVLPRIKIVDLLPAQEV